MPFLEAARVALESLRANKLRSFLTVLGILIGVASVVAVVAITEGLDHYISDQVLELGGRTFYVQKFPDVITSHQQWLDAQKRRDITMADLDAVRQACSACAEVGGMNHVGKEVKYGRTTQSGVEVQGITENMPRIGTVRDLLAGRHLMAADVDHARNVVVIGADVSDAFFKTAEPIGKEITIDERPYTVVGVAERKGSVFGERQDNFVCMPITLFRKVYGTRTSVVIEAQSHSMADYEQSQEQARVVMRNRRHLGFQKDDDFSIETGESVMDLWKSATGGIYVVTLVVTAISLLVGGVVVMNIMLVSVSERVREIGVRKALGARRRDIVRQFLVESVVLSVAGGALGIAGATAGAKLLAMVLGGIMSVSFTAPIRLWAIGAALAVSGTVGLVAGIYPASRAAALDPVVALRSE